MNKRKQPKPEPVDRPAPAVHPEQEEPEDGSK